MLPVGEDIKETLIIEEKYIRKVKNYTPGEVFGERELILGTLREAKATAKSNKLVLYLISKEDFFNNFTLQERESLLAHSDSSISSPEIAKKLKHQINADHKKYSALLNASEIKRIKSGRGLFEENVTERHTNYAKGLVNRHKKNISKLLVGTDYKINHVKRIT